MRGRRPTIYTNEFIDAVIHSYVVKRNPYSRVTKEFGICQGTVHDILASHGVHIRHQKRIDGVDGTVCGCCHQFKPFSEFYKWRTRKGYMSDCKPCARLKMKFHKARRDNLPLRAKAEYKGRTAALATLRNLEIKIEVLAHYGNGKCACVKCGQENIRALSIDHINGRGNTQRRDDKIGSNMYRWLKRHGFPEGYQTLCMSCQFIKADEDKERLRQYQYPDTPKKEYRRHGKLLESHTPTNLDALALLNNKEAQ